MGLRLRGDDIIIKGAGTGRVAGGRGSDYVELDDCRGVLVSPLSPAEQEYVLPLDVGDNYVLRDAVSNEVHGGDGDDNFTLSGDVRSNALVGGNDNDFFWLKDGPVFSTAHIHGGPHDDSTVSPVISRPNTLR